MGDGYSYAGDELQLFAGATRWKRYVHSQASAFLKGRVLEVGAGLGATTRVFWSDRCETWTCLEPDAALARAIPSSLQKPLPSDRLTVVVGTIHDLTDDRVFDTILYMDVLEHIPDASAELMRASEHLSENGCLVVLAPAHEWLFSEFDEAIGHLRRYTKQGLRAVVPDALTCCKLVYLDSCGVLLSLANRFILRKHEPSRRQVEFWDHRVIPLSRVADRLVRYSIGKSILGIWRKKPRR